jgi:hypothetical protein
VTAAGQRVLALAIRRLPNPAAEPHALADGERIDLLALTRYRDGTKSWHIADCNSELDARELNLTPGRIVRVPQE